MFVLLIIFLFMHSYIITEIHIITNCSHDLSLHIYISEMPYLNINWTHKFGCPIYTIFRTVVVLDQPVDKLGMVYKTKTKLCGLSPWSNYSDWATAACRRSCRYKIWKYRNCAVWRDMHPKTKLNSMSWVGKRTIPTEWPPFIIMWNLYVPVPLIASLMLELLIGLLYCHSTSSVAQDFYVSDLSTALDHYQAFTSVPTLLHYYCHNYRYLYSPLLKVHIRPTFSTQLITKLDVLKMNLPVVRFKIILLWYFSIILLYGTD
jgi:hypothetical protein